MALVVGEPQPPAAKLPPQHPVLLLEVGDHLKLAPVHPPGEEHQQETQRLHPHRLTIVPAAVAERGPGRHRQAMKTPWIRRGSQAVLVYVGVKGNVGKVAAIADSMPTMMPALQSLAAGTCSRSLPVATGGNQWQEEVALAIVRHAVR